MHKDSLEYQLQPLPGKFCLIWSGCKVISDSPLRVQSVVHFRPCIVLDWYKIDSKWCLWQDTVEMKILPCHIRQHDIVGPTSLKILYYWYMFFDCMIFVCPLYIALFKYSIFRSKSIHNHNYLQFIAQQDDDATTIFSLEWLEAR